MNLNGNLKDETENLVFPQKLKVGDNFFQGLFFNDFGYI